MRLRDSLTPGPSSSSSSRAEAGRGGEGRQETALKPSVEGTVNFYFQFIYAFHGSFERLTPPLSLLSVISENLEP